MFIIKQVHKEWSRTKLITWVLSGIHNPLYILAHASITALLTPSSPN